MKSKKGFTLIELMIVVAIIAIIAAIAIPSLLGAKKSANEANAIGSLRTLSTCLEQYRVSQVPPSYPVAQGIPGLALLNAGGFIDSALASGSKNGYTYTYASADPDGDGAFDTYTVNADPITQGTTGTRHFFLDDSGVIRVDPAVAATVASAPLE